MFGNEIFTSRKSYPLFGSTIDIVLINAEDPIAQTIADETYEVGLNLQKIFNFHDPESELSKLNQKHSLKVSKELLHVIKKAIFFCELSEGEYDIALGKNFLERKKGKGLTSIAASFKGIIIRGSLVGLEHKDIMIDLGSIAKGYIAQEMANHLKKSGVESGYVDARGDIVAFGDEIEIGIQNPRPQKTDLEKTKDIMMKIKIKNRCIATSGDYSQFIKTYDESHIINKKEIISATVVCDDMILSEGYSSILMVCDRLKRESIMKRPEIFSKVMAMTIDKDMKVQYYNGFEKLKVPTYN